MMNVVSPAAMRIRIASDGDLARAVLEAGRVAKAVGFDASLVAMLSTAVSELARNILKYAGNGEIFVEKMQHGVRNGVRVIAKDKGPGIEDVEQAMADHFSSSGTLGLGLPGVKRLMDEFEIESAPGRGTRVTVTKWSRTGRPEVRRSGTGVPHPRRPTTGRLKADTEGERGSRVPSRRPEADSRGVDHAVYGRPCIGERVSGDFGLVIEREGLLFLAIADIVGHGPEAHVVAVEARRYLVGSWTPDLTETVTRLHEELKGGRGAAVGLATLEIASGEVRYVGVGNTVIRRLGSQEARLFSADGNIGETLRTPREQSLRLAKDDVLALYTDGLRTNFEVDDYPQLRYERAAAIAKTLVSRFGRSYDDATCLVVRYPR
jgi:anti-sigma regulatory factor (Ser/Thr protein kinase)